MELSPNTTISWPAMADINLGNKSSPLEEKIISLIISF